MNKKAIEIIEPAFVEYTAVCFYYRSFVQTINALFRSGSNKIFLTDFSLVKKLFPTPKIYELCSFFTFETLLVLSRATCFRMSSKESLDFFELACSASLFISENDML